MARSSAASRIASGRAAHGVAILTPAPAPHNPAAGGARSRLPRWPPTPTPSTPPGTTPSTARAATTSTSGCPSPPSTAAPSSRWARARGRIALPLARAGHAVTALDPSPAMLAIARRRAAAEGLAVTFLDGRLPGAELPPAAFATVILPNDVLLACADPGEQEAALRAAASRPRPPRPPRPRRRRPRPLARSGRERRAHPRLLRRPQRRAPGGLARPPRRPRHPHPPAPHPLRDHGRGRAGPPHRERPRSALRNARRACRNARLRRPPSPRHVGRLHARSIDECQRAADCYRRTRGRSAWPGTDLMCSERVAKRSRVEHGA